MYLFNGSIFTIKASEFKNNSAAHGGGVLYSFNSNVTIGGSNFTENSSPEGAVIQVTDGSKLQYCNNLLIKNNSANMFAVTSLINSEFKGNHSGNITFSSNIGSLMALNSRVTFNGFATFVNNQPDISQTTTLDDFHEGGAITLIQSDAFFDGECTLEHNHAVLGGAIHSTGSRLYVNDNVTVRG